MLLLVTTAVLGWTIVCARAIDTIIRKIFRNGYQKK